MGVGRVVEARSLHVVVWSNHSDADEEVAEAIARVLTRYAVDFKYRGTGGQERIDSRKTAST